MLGGVGGRWVGLLFFAIQVGKAKNIVEKKLFLLHVIRFFLFAINEAKVQTGRLSATHSTGPEGFILFTCTTVFAQASL